MTKPDRIARAVERMPHYTTVAAMRKAIPNLLRREAAYQLAQVRKIVKAQRPKGHDRIVANREEISCNLEKCYWLACDDLLAVLTPRRTR
jgi:hypothetical protein